MATTAQQRAASAKYHQKRRDAGLAKVTLWLTPGARTALKVLAESFGSQDAAAEALLNSEHATRMVPPEG